MNGRKAKQERRRLRALHLIDQVDAAEEQADRLLVEAATVMEGKVGVAEVGPWTYGLVADIAARARAGFLLACQHMQEGTESTGIQPLFATAWRPGHVACGQCLPAIMAPSEEDFTCDKCGTEDRAGMRPRMVRVPPLLTIMFGLCGECSATEGVAA